MPFQRKHLCGRILQDSEKQLNRNGEDLIKTLCPNLTAAEGFVLGLGAKMFVIAGPVIVYGTVASVVYGIIYWITTLF